MEYLGILRYNVDASTFTVVTSPRIRRVRVRLRCAAGCCVFSAQVDTCTVYLKKVPEYRYPLYRSTGIRFKKVLLLRGYPPNNKLKHTTHTRRF